MNAVRTSLWRAAAGFALLGAVFVGFEAWRAQRQLGLMRRRRLPAGRRKHVVVLGAGFGGLYTTMHVEQVLKHDPALRLTLVDRHNYHLFTPMLTLVAGGLVEARHVIYPVRRLLRRRCFTFREREVRGIDLDARSVETLDGPIDYDVLVLALGSVTNFFNIPNLGKLSFPFKTVPDAVRLRNHIVDLFERAAQEDDANQRHCLLTFVIAGGGPTGIELAATLNDFIHHSLIEEYPSMDFSEVRLIVVETRERILPNLDQDLARVAGRTLARKNVELHLGKTISVVEPDRVQTNDGQWVDTHTVVWAAGVEANPIVATLPVAKGRNGGAVVDQYFRLPEHPEVLALGDNAWCVDPRTGSPLPADAKVAIRQADWVAKNLVHQIYGEPLEAFSYEPIGDMISLGAWSAVVDLKGVKLSGFPAWLLWRTYYLGRLFGAENKLRVIGDWLLDSVFERDTTRLEAA